MDNRRRARRSHIVGWQLLSEKEERDWHLVGTVYWDSLKVKKLAQRVIAPAFGLLVLYLPTFPGQRHGTAYMVELVEAIRGFKV